MIRSIRMYPEDIALLKSEVDSMRESEAKDDTHIIIFLSKAERHVSFILTEAERIVIDAQIAFATGAEYILENISDENSNIRS